MLRILLTGLVILVSTQSVGASIAGLWVPPAGNAIIEITVDGEEGELQLTVQRLLQPAEVDYNNPDPRFQSRPLLGVQIGQGFAPGEKGDARGDESGGDVWKGGEVYEPGSGNTYNAQLRLIDENHVRVRGYVGTPLFGREETWTRYELFRERMLRMLDLECAS